jgi:ATP-dependent DNA ligase
MLAAGTHEIPEGDFLYEPKWDGFRTLVFKDGDDVYLQSRDSKPMLRYFPELLAPLQAQLPPRVVLDGELVIVSEQGLEFDLLQMRLHPAKSRIDKLAQETPAEFVAFDCLALGDRDLRESPFGERRALLEDAMRGAHRPLHLTPATRDIAVARDWFQRFEGAGFDGVVAKPLGEPYRPGKRAMAKVKHDRTADCVLAGFRWHKDGQGTEVGSLMLALYTDSGELHPIGVAASFSKTRRKELVDELAPLRADIGEHPWSEWAGSSPSEHSPGFTSRWNAGKDLSWESVRIERVVEVSYNHFDGRRFRHPVQFKRWRLDKSPRDCTFAQMEAAPPIELQLVFGA